MSGILDFHVIKNLNKFEYKYAMQVKSEDKEHLFIEFLGKSHINRFFIYDSREESKDFYFILA